MNTFRFLFLHHTVIPPWIYRIPSELRSQAGLGLPSTVVGDHTGIVSAVCCFVLHHDKNFLQCLVRKSNYVLTVSLELM